MNIKYLNLFSIAQGALKKVTVGTLCVCISLFAVCLLTACEKPENDPTEISIWKCTPNPDIVITLSLINSPEKNIMYIKTSPDTLPRIHTIRISQIIEYRMRGDTMCPLQEDGTYYYDNRNYDLLTMLSADSMVMSRGRGSIRTFIRVNDYLFIRQPNQKYTL